MQFKKALNFQDIPSFLKMYERHHDLNVFPELSFLAKSNESTDEQLRALVKSAKDHGADALRMIKDLNAPYLYEAWLQMVEKNHLKEKLSTFWNTPISACGFGPSTTAGQIIEAIKVNMVRYLRINAVIEADFKEYSVTNKSSDPADFTYVNFKSYWYDDDGEKYRAVSMNYGRLLKKGKNQNEPRAVHEHLVHILTKLYKRMGYIIAAEPRLSSGVRADLVVKKGDKEWYIEVKSEHQENYKRMVMNYELWSKYLSTYDLLKTGSWTE